MTTHTVPVAPAAAPVRRSPLVRARVGFTRFRRTRPFWGSLVLGLGGYLVLNPLLGGSWDFYIALGAKGVMPIVLGGGMIAAALVAVVTPAQRHFPAIIASMFSVASLPLANLGGWVVGMLLGIVGAGMVFAWTPYSAKQLARINARAAARAERRSRRRRAA